MGKYKEPHFDAKGEANHLFTDSGVPNTFLLTSFYRDNFIYFGMGPKRGGDGKLGARRPAAASATIRLTSCSVPVNPSAL